MSAEFHMKIRIYFMFYLKTNTGLSTARFYLFHNDGLETQETHKFHKYLPKQLKTRTNIVYLRDLLVPRTLFV